jgi:hypothetical protein
MSPPLAANTFASVGLSSTMPSISSLSEPNIRPSRRTPTPQPMTEPRCNRQARPNGVPSRLDA